MSLPAVRPSRSGRPLRARLLMALAAVLLAPHIAPAAHAGTPSADEDAPSALRERAPGAPEPGAGNDDDTLRLLEEDDRWLVEAPEPAPVSTETPGDAANDAPATPAAAEPAPGEHAHEHPHGRHPDTEEIIVTATPLAHDRDEVAAAVERIGRDAILEGLGSTLGETLRNVPGVTSSGFSAGASRPVIRGQDAFRTEVVENGLTTQDVSRISPDHGVPVNPLSAEAIEVVRGAAALRYGGGAVAGVVNAITNRVPREPIAEPLTGEAFVAWGENGNARDLAIELEGGFEPPGREVGPDAGALAWHLDALSRESDDYESAGVRQRGTHTDANAISTGASWIGERGRLGFAWSRFENRYGVPEPGADVSIDMRTNRYRLEGDLEAPLPGLREARLRAVYSDYAHDELDAGVVGQTFLQNEFEGRLEALHEPVAGLQGAFGVHARFQDLRAEGSAAAFLAPSRTAMGALYLFEERALAPRVGAELGLRSELQQVRGTPSGAARRTRSFAPTSGSAGLVLGPFGLPLPAGPAALTLGIVGSATQRAPSQIELFARGPHEATGTFEIGDPALDVETAYGGELRAAFDWGSAHLEATQFLTRYDGYLVGALTGAFVDDNGVPLAPGTPGALSELRYRARDARFVGGELSFDADLFTLCGGNVTLDGRFDWVHARFTGAGPDENVPRITPMRWGAGLGWSGERLRAHVGFTRSEAQRRTAPFETPTKGFTFVDARLAWSLVAFDDRVAVDLLLVGRNLNDARGRNHVSFKKDDVALPGRSLSAGLRARF